MLLTSRLHRILSILAFCGAVLAVCPAVSQGSESLWSQRPVVRFSDVWCGPNNATLIGYFDVSYFNSELPRGSKITIHYGFEEVSLVSPPSQNSSKWLYRDASDLKQWEEFGWYGRISRQVATRYSQSKISALDFYFEVLLPDGRRVFSLGDEDSPKAYYRAEVPDMRVCKDLGHERLKICATSLSVVAMP
jgi:hypothetical protein